MVPFTRRTMLKVGLTALLIPAALSGCGRRAADRSFEDWRREFESRVQDRMRAANVVGAAVAITCRDTSRRYTAAFGYADLASKRPFTDDTPTHLASVSKLFTASALVQLFERRGYNLDDDINRFIDFPVRNPGHPNVPITPRHLLTHTSSISDEGYGDTSLVGDPTQSLSSFLRDYLVPGGSAHSPTESFLPEKPGARWDYSNVAMALAGHVMEAVSKQDFSSYVQDNIFDPLGIANARWYLKEFASNTISRPYRFEDGRFVELPQEGYPDVPAGMLRCSVSDLSTSLRAMLGGGTGTSTILSPASVEAMLRSQVDPAVAHYQGLGWTEEEIHGRAFVGHSGSDNGASNMVVLSADHSRAVVLLMNIDGTEATGEFRSSVIEDLLVGTELMK